MSGMAGGFAVEQLVFEAEAVDNDVLRPIQCESSHAALVADHECETIVRVSFLAVTLEVFAVGAHWI